VSGTETGPLITAAVGGAGDGSVRRRRVDAVRRTKLLDEVEELLLAEGFTTVSMDDVAQRLRCSKATLYSVAGSKEQLVVKVTKEFFRRATEQIENAVAAVTDPRLRISAYLSGVGEAMSRCSSVFYADMIGFGPTAEIYGANSQAAARRVQELIAAGVEEGSLRRIDGNFAGQLVALAIEGVQSGVLLRRTGLTAGEAYQEMADLLLHGLSRSEA
jgi:AcrR family transcriptional regulator